MKKLPLILLMSFGLASAAFAQTATGGVTMSTDPAKAAAVERHAAELKARPAPEVQAKPTTTTSSAKHKKPATKPSGSKAKTQAKPIATK